MILMYSLIKPQPLILLLYKSYIYKAMEVVVTAKRSIVHKDVSTVYCQLTLRK
jgi:hypothetical protein